jgi:alpha-tubulin suppressor-like RCC1 family protein
MAAAGCKFGACVTEDGSVWTWGSNLYGQLGVGTYDIAGVPVPQHHSPLHFGKSRAAMVACGHDFTLILSEAGHVWTSGSNQWGVLGHNDAATFHKRHTFQQIDAACFGNVAVKMIAAGAEHCIAACACVDTRHRVWTWGRNDRGQLGQGTYKDVAVPTLVANTAFGDSVVESVHAGYDYTMVVTCIGELFSCGNGCSGELGLGSTDSYDSFQRVGGPFSALFGPRGVRTVACGTMHTIILARDNAVWSCGNGSAPCLGTTDEQGLDILHPTLLPRGLVHNRHVVAIGASELHSAVVTAQGRAYTWGQGRRFQQYATGLGDGTTLPRWRPWLLTLDRTKGVRAGRWHRTPPEHIMAFAMCTHQRVGVLCGVLHHFPADLVKIISSCVDYEPRTENGRGFLTMLGFD